MNDIFIVVSKMAEMCIWSCCICMVFHVFMSDVFSVEEIETLCRRID